MAVAIVILVVLVALSIAGVLGWTADSRDPKYGVGAFLRYAHREGGPHKDSAP